MKKIAIVQSNYIPWKGYFDLIAAVDEFILFDDMQYTRRDWRNRNQIKTPQGLQWLTVPVHTKGKFHQKIKQTKIVGEKWQEEHWKSISLNYQKTAHFNEVSSWLKPLYLDSSYSHISHLNLQFITNICSYLGIKTIINKSSSYDLIDGKTERLVSLCLQAGGTEYISGIAAQNYIEEQYFAESNIDLTWFDYSGYTEYPQLWGEFTHNVTILDLLFNCGPSASNYLRHLK